MTLRQSGTDRADRRRRLRRRRPRQPEEVEAGWFVRENVVGVIPGSGEFTVYRRPTHNRAHVLVIFDFYDDPCAWEARVGVRETPISYRFRWIERPNVWECT